MQPEVFVLILLVVFIVILALAVYDQNEHTRVTDFFRKYLPGPPLRILDVGSGRGCNASGLERLGHAVVPLDVVDGGTCEHPILYDGNSIPFSDNSFDVALASFMLHHADNWEAVLGEMRRVAPRLVVFENTPEAPIDEWLTRRHAESHWGGRPEGFKTHEEWLETFGRLGLHVSAFERIPRVVFPFAGKPFFYPVPSVAYLLETR